MRRVVLVGIMAIAVGAVGATATEAADSTCKAKHEKKGCPIKGHWSYSALVRREVRPGFRGVSRYSVSMKSKKSFVVYARGLPCGDQQFYDTAVSVEVGKQAHIGKTYTKSRNTAGSDVTATVTFTSAKKAKLSLEYTVRSTTAEGTTSCPAPTRRR